MKAQDPRLRTVNCAAVPITVCSLIEAVNEVLRLALRERGADVHLCNAYTLALADKSPDYGDMLRSAAVNFPDGKSVVWANRLRFGRSIPANRVYGPDLFLDVLAVDEPQLRHYLLGGTPAVLQSLREQIERRYPSVQIVGAESPPFRALTETEVAAQFDRIRESAANLVWIGLGTPKQDWVSARLAGELPAVFVAVGAAFDFIAGAKRQAPAWMRQAGLEWLFRLATEPQRLWRRYLFGNVRFILAVTRDCSRGRAAHN